MSYAPPRSAGGIPATSGIDRETEDRMARAEIEPGDVFEDVERSCEAWLRRNDRSWKRYDIHKQQVLDRRAARLAGIPEAELPHTVYPNV